MRQIEDIQTILAWPRIGTVETAMAQGWRLFHHYNPDVTVAVIRRPTSEVVQSMLAIDLKGYATYDKERLSKVMAYGNRMLDEICQEMPGALVLDYADLGTEQGCRAIFEHCLPFQFDRDWWLKLKDRNLQVNVAEHIRYYHENRPEIEAFKKTCWRELRHLRQAGKIRKGMNQKCQVSLSPQPF